MSSHTVLVTSCLGPPGRTLLLQGKDVRDNVKVNGKEELGQRTSVGSVSESTMPYNHKPRARYLLASRTLLELRRRTKRI